MRSWTRLRGNLVIAANLRGQKKAAFRSRDEIEAKRDQRIRSIVGYAARWVPYYREYFARSGVDAREIRGAADLDRLPILDKALVRRQPQQFVAETAAARDALAFCTSGTTGTPTRVWHDRHSLLANIAFGERERDPVIRKCGGALRPTEIYVGYPTSTFKQVQAFYDDHTLLPRPRRRFVSLLEPIEAIAALANSERPDVLVGYGGWIDLFFKTVVARRIALRPPRVVVYMGEALPFGARDYIRTHFGIPVLSRYNAVEAFKIAFSCEQENGFHLHEDLCHVRLVGGDGRTVPTGERGEVVISNLINRATVLLNYPMGDIATSLPGVCACGRSLLRLSEIDGRVEDILALADGRCVHPRVIWEVFKGDPEVLQYQLTQHELQRFALTLTSADAAAFQRSVHRAMPELERILGPDARIETIRSNGDARGGSGKFRAVAALRPPDDPD